MSVEDNSWVFDSLVAFLNGPIWNAPLQSFIEEKSLIFEPSVTENEEYKKIFDEFKNLSIFEQIWAANDFQMFVRMMTQRNVELQLQALELIEKKYGITPQSFIPKRNDGPESGVTINIPVVVERESKLEKEILDEVAKRFVEEEPSTSTAEIKELMEQKPILEQTLKESIEQKQIAEPETNKPDKPKENLRPETKIKKPEMSQNLVDSLEFKKRQEYLRAQRDKLVALKKQARQKQLTTEAGPKSKNRPKSARAAEAVLTGEKSNIEASQLQIRKTLVERLKAEVVDKDLK
ncbi:unnamed protein product [Ceutorhynchus assimilis]|uniref:Cilia- and flagella-associated protein 36 n=1 Tax=Ceutorhynchus assimilis TaxID=467358 RepID=A0A9P0DGT8_9CUCU|nr:unnamed protein product [Ceutorhynchus assimilis]